LEDRGDWIALDRILDQALVHEIQVHVVLLVSLHKEAADSSEQHVYKMDFWRIFIVSKRKAQLNILVIIYKMKDQRICVRLVYGHEHHSALPITR